MYSQEHTPPTPPPIPTQHFGSAISDYHIHNSVCMFELLLWAPAWYAVRVESSASSAWLSSEREELEEEEEKKKIYFYHDAKTPSHIVKAP